MSLYHALFGVNPFSETLLQMLGTSRDAIPRYRDCFLNEDGTEIIIHTRTGGGNRDHYENAERRRRNDPDCFTSAGEPPAGPWNEDLRAIPGFKFDRDDDFDATYADFHYDVPEACREQVAVLKELGAVADPAKRWQAVLEGLRARDTSNPDVVRALAVGEQIFARLKDAGNPQR